MPNIAATTGKHKPKLSRFPYKFGSVLWQPRRYSTVMSSATMASSVQRGWAKMLA